MKKIIAIMLCVAMVFTFAACGGKDAEETTTEAKAVETTTSPMVNAETRFSHLATMNVWTKGEKVLYEKGATKVMTATAALNDSVIHDTLKVVDTKADFEAMKRNDSCVEITYEKDMVASFSGKKVTYDQIIVATSGKLVNTIFFLKDGAVAGSPIGVTNAEGRKTLSENLAGAVAVIVHEGHTH